MTVIVAESEAVAPCWSVTVRVRSMAVSWSTCGAVRVVDGAVASAKTMSSVESWVHR